MGTLAAVAAVSVMTRSGSAGQLLLRRRGVTRAWRRIFSGSWGTTQWLPSRNRLNPRATEVRTLAQDEGNEALSQQPRSPKQHEPPAQTFHAH